MSALMVYYTTATTTAATTAAAAVIQLCEEGSRHRQGRHGAWRQSEEGGASAVLISLGARGHRQGQERESTVDRRLREQIRGDIIMGPRAALART